MQFKHAWVLVSALQDGRIPTWHLQLWCEDDARFETECILVRAKSMGTLEGV